MDLKVLLGMCAPSAVIAQIQGNGPDERGVGGERGNEARRM